MLSYEFDLKQGKVPLVIGVTGHRDLPTEAIPKLKQSVEAFFEEKLFAKYPHTPITVLSPLAEGADALVAEVALRYKATGRDIRLVCPLPLPLEAYMQDMTSAYRVEFQRLYSQANEHIELPLLEGNTSDNIQALNGPHRNKQYAALGAYIAHQSHILLALWDGKRDQMKEGGTAYVVTSMLDGNHDFDDMSQTMEIYDTGAVYHIVTPRKQAEGVVGTLYEGGYQYPEIEIDSMAHINKRNQEKMYGKIFSNIEMFNERLEKQSREQLRQSFDFLTKHNEVVMDPAMLTQDTMALVHPYVAADTLAIRHSKIKRNSLLTLYIGGFASVLFMQIYGTWSWKTGLFIYLVTLVILTLFTVGTKKLRLDQSNLDFRALAEGLRIQLFMHMAGIPVEMDEHFLRQQRSELQWISYALRSVSLRQSVLPAGDRTLRFRQVLTFWVQSQMKFYTRNRSHLRKALLTINILSGLCLTLGFVVAVGLFWNHPLLNADEVQKVLSFTVGLSIFSALLVNSYAQATAMREMLRSYDQMYMVFTMAGKRLRSWLPDNEALSEKPLDTVKEKRIMQLLTQLGYEALEETSWWVIMHRERKLEPIKG